MFYVLQLNILLTHTHTHVFNIDKNAIVDQPVLTQLRRHELYRYIQIFDIWT